MQVYVNKKMMGRVNYPKLISEFPEVDFVDEITDGNNIEVVVCMPDFLVKHDIYKFKNLKWIQYLMAGYDTVNVKKLNEHNILFSNAQDIFSTSIAEDVFTKIFYFNRNVKHYLEAMKDKEWRPIKKEPELTGSVIGILGVGSIGKEIAKRMIPFGVKKIIGYRSQDRQAKYFDEIYTGKSGLYEVIKQSDYLIVALPLNKFTENIINDETLGLMKEDAILINVGRGPLVDQSALIKALQNKKIRGAGLDVTAPEPLPKDSPLWEMENVYITPHNASSSPYMKDRLFQLTVENLRRYIEGEEVKYLIKQI